MVVDRQTEELSVKMLPSFGTRAQHMNRHPLSHCTQRFGGRWENVGKCGLVRFGRNEYKTGYCLNGKKLQNSEVHRELGVLVHSSQDVSMQVRVRQCI